MKIFEITDKNETWSVISGVETEFDISNEFEVDYSDIVELLKILDQLKSQHSVLAAMPTILAFEDKLIKFVNYLFPNEDDVDLEKRKNRANEMLHQISLLKQQLPK